MGSPVQPNLCYCPSASHRVVTHNFFLECSPLHPPRTGVLFPSLVSTLPPCQPNCHSHLALDFDISAFERPPPLQPPRLRVQCCSSKPIHLPTAGLVHAQVPAWEPPSGSQEGRSHIRSLFPHVVAQVLNACPVHERVAGTSSEQVQIVRDASRNTGGPETAGVSRTLSKGRGPAHTGRCATHTLQMLLPRDALCGQPGLGNECRGLSKWP